MLSLIKKIREPCHFKMKILLSIFFFFVSVNAKTQHTSIDSVITKESLTHTISALAHDSMKGRLTASAEALNAAKFIALQFENAGLKPVSGNDLFFAYYPLKYQIGNNIYPVQAINVIGALPGMESPDTLVIFCAHYDHIGQKELVQKNMKDSIYNGANDNASGVAVITELAKYYAANRINRYTLLFMAFSGEELGLLGSAYTYKQMNPDYIRAVINFDMVGRPLASDEDHCMVIAEFYQPIIRKLNAGLPDKKKFFVPDQYPDDHLNERSDHYSFNKIRTSFSIMCSSPYDEFYHSVQDEVGTIDFDFLLEATRKIAIACEAFIK